MYIITNVYAAELYFHAPVESTGTESLSRCGNLFKDIELTILQITKRYQFNWETRSNKCLTFCLITEM